MNKPFTYGGRLALVEPLTEERASYNEMLARYAAEGVFDENYTGPDIVPFPSSLRSDIVLTGNLANPTSLVYNFRTDSANQGMLAIQQADKRLDINDAFMARRVRLVFGIKAEAADISTTQFQTFANAAAATGLPGGGFGVIGAAAVGRALAGWLDLTVNTVKYMEQLACDPNFVYVDEAQAGTAVSSVALTGIQGFSTTVFPRGWKELTPQMLFSGSDKTAFELTIQQPSTFTVAGFHIVASLQMEGLRIQNGGRFNVVGR